VNLGDRETTFSLFSFILYEKALPINFTIALSFVRTAFLLGRTDTGLTREADNVLAETKFELEFKLQRGILVCPEQGRSLEKYWKMS
jgi:hypothetical protein